MEINIQRLLFVCLSVTETFENGEIKISSGGCHLGISIKNMKDIDFVQSSL
jgi:hypothetical protein